MINILEQQQTTTTLRGKERTAFFHQGWWGGVGVEKRLHTWEMVVSLRIINLKNTVEPP